MEIGLQQIKCNSIVCTNKVLHYPRWRNSSFVQYLQKVFYEVNILKNLWKFEEKRLRQSSILKSCISVSCITKTTTVTHVEYILNLTKMWQNSALFQLTLIWITTTPIFSLRLWAFNQKSLWLSRQIFS